MLNLIRYLSAKRRYPESTDFVNMGLGIEARYRRCRSFWSKHIELTKEFQAELFSKIEQPESAAVLGAGRLYDVDLEFLKSKFKSLSLYDADPTVLPVWRKACSRLPDGIAVDQYICDVTGTLSTWTNKLRDFLRDSKKGEIEQLIPFLGDLNLSDFALSSKYSGILSVNLLSQIPIYWRDRFQSELGRHWDLDTDDNGNYDPPLQKALENSMGLLQSGHLEMLSCSQAKVVVVITDAWFYYYKKNMTTWQSERALFLDREVSLEGYDLDDSRSWLWHIAPQDIEQPGYGIIHKVNAYGFVNRED